MPSASRSWLPDRDVRPFQDVLIDLGARLRLPGFSNADGSAEIPGRLRRLHRQSRAPAGHRLARRTSRQERVRLAAVASPIHASSSTILPMAASTSTTCPSRCAISRTPTRAYHRLGCRSWAFASAPTPVIFQLYSEPLQKIRLAARGHGPVLAAAPASRAHRDVLRSPALLVCAVRRCARRRSRLSAACHHAAADGDVPFLGFAKCLAAPDPRRQLGYIWAGARRQARHQRRRLGLDRKPQRPRQGAGAADGGVNPDTVWTWNAIGKRAGAWGLRSAGTGGHARLPPQSPDRRAAAGTAHGGYRYANADPITGQAAWYDLRVRIEKVGAAEAHATSPRLAPLRPPPGLAGPGAARHLQEAGATRAGDKR